VVALARAAALRPVRREARLDEHDRLAEDDAGLRVAGLMHRDHARIVAERDLAAARLVQRILQEHVGRGELIDDAEIAGLAPELGEPPTDNSLAVFCFAHLDTLSCLCREATDRNR